MSKKRKSLPRVRLRPADRASMPDDDDEVGYAKPPRDHQFKPGESGNPKGRPLGAKSEANILQELLYRKISVRIGGRLRKIPVIHAIYWRMTEESLRGNIKSAAFLFSRLGSISTGDSQTPDMTEDDREILEAYAQRLIADVQKEKTS